MLVNSTFELINNQIVLDVSQLQTGYYIVNLEGPSEIIYPGYLVKD
ncbi:MAG: hypothetical protein ACI9O4_001975 [Chitinophagales bacterium]|jgi:hypothetical protein